MIEQVIYFALGCIVTALLALLFAPVFWSRALRLTRKRLQLQVPLSTQEILAERDQLRAQHAVERLRIEQDMARARAGKDADMAALGRRTVEAARLAEEVGALRKLSEAQKREIALLTAAVAEHKVESAELRKDLASAHANVEGLQGEAETAAREHARLKEEGEGHRRGAAALVSRIAELEAAQARVASLEKELAAVRDEAGRQATPGTGPEPGRGAAAERLDRLEAENTALKRAMEALEPDGGSDTTMSGEAGLRESIHALGLAVATMTRARERGDAPPPRRQPERSDS